MADLPPPTLRTRQWGYVTLRLALGLNFFLHGATRLPDLNGFAGGMAESFADTILPDVLVYTFGTVLPFFELTIGVLLLLGLFMRRTLLVGVGVMLCLIFGTGLQQNWGSIALQMQYVLYFAVLLVFLPYNAYALDARRA